MTENILASALYEGARSYYLEAQKIRESGGPYSEEKWCLDRAAELVSRADRLELAEKGR